MKKILLITLLFSAVTNAQTLTLSLEDAIAYGLKNSYATINSTRDVAIAKNKRWETIATGLPQINAKVDYQSWIKQQVSLIPAEVFGGKKGEFAEVNFGTKQNVNASATMSQLIFNGSYLVGLQSAKTYLKISELAKIKTEEAVREAIINAYGNVLITEETVLVLEKNKKSLNKNLHELTQMYKNGFVEEESVEQLKLTLASVKSKLSQTNKMKDIAYKMLNITLGADISTKVTLTDDLPKLALENIDLESLKTEINIKKHIDYLIAQNTQKSNELLVKFEQSKALPSINAFVNYGYSANNNDFNFFDKSQKWFDSSLLGVSLNIPIFTSLGRTAKIQQAKIEFEKSKTNLSETEQKLILQLEKSKADYTYAVEEYQNSKSNLQLAERIEKKQQIKFFEGISTSFDLLDAQRQLYGMQQSYLQSMLNLITAKASLNKSINSF